MHSAAQHAAAWASDPGWLLQDSKDCARLQQCTRAWRLLLRLLGPAFLADQTHISGPMLKVLAWACARVDDS